MEVEAEGPGLRLWSASHARREQSVSRCFVGVVLGWVLVQVACVCERMWVVGGWREEERQRGRLGNYGRRNLKKVSRKSE